MKKILTSVIVTVLFCLCFAGSTYAWLVATTTPVQNAFTAGNINIRLSETTSINKKMVPGATLESNPKVTVDANSEDCWLFVKAEKSSLFDTFLEFEIADGWTLLNGTSNVYWRRVALSENDQEFGVLKGNVVNVKSAPTKAQYDAITENNYPSVTFTAYAVQQLGFADAAAAWEEAKQLTERT